VTVRPEAEAMLRRMYAAFDARDVEAVAEVLHPDVDWPNAWEGGRVAGTRRCSPTGAGSSPRSTRG
jgi:ketosteroid isomerase-like protein